MEHLFPYKQTKNKAFFRDGKKEIVLTRKGNDITINKRTTKTLDWNIGETAHLDKFKITYKK